MCGEEAPSSLWCNVRVLSQFRLGDDGGVRYGNYVLGLVQLSPTHLHSCCGVVLGRYGDGFLHTCASWYEPWPSHATITPSPTAVFPANWAQITGPKLQNAAVVGSTGFTPRWGMAAAVIENRPESDEIVQSDAEKSKLFVMGGDDYLDRTGGGVVHNDVWFTTGHGMVRSTLPGCFVLSH